MMAGEINISGSVKMNKGNLSIERKVNSLLIDMTGNALYWNVQSVGITDEAVAIGADIGTLGVAWFRNLDALHFVQIGIKPSGTFIPVARLKAGEFAILRLEPGVALYAMADTAPVQLEVLILPD